MGRPKATLPLTEHTALARILSLCAHHDLPALVVTGAHPEATRAAAQDLLADFLHHPDWRLGRTSSLQAGWRALGPRPVLLWPVDVPLVRASTLTALLNPPQAPICVPSYERRRGHPVILDASLRDPVLALDPDAPLRDLVRAHAARGQVHHVAVDDPAVRWDLNTPEDHARYVAQAGLDAELGLGANESAS